MRFKTQSSNESFEDVEQFMRSLTQGPHLSEADRARIWHKARAKAQKESPRRAPWYRRLAFYPLFVLLLAFSFVGGYVGVVLAEGASVPGDPLYVIERSAEAIWLSLTPNSHRCEVELVLLQRRLYEARALLGAGQTLPDSLLQEIELLFMAIADDPVAWEHCSTPILPHIIQYRDDLHRMVERYPGVWGLFRVLQAADLAATQLGADPIPLSGPPVTDPDTGPE